MTFHDWRGTEIKAGSIVVYPSRQSSSMWVNEGVVIDVDEVDERGRRCLKGHVRKTREHSYGSTKETPDAKITSPDFSRVTVVG